MLLKKKSYAGSLESSDVMIRMEPSDNGIELNIDSTVISEYGDAIRKTVLDTLEKLEVKNGRVFVDDRGALDLIIISRVQTAALRAAEIKTYEWEV